MTSTRKSSKRSISRSNDQLQSVYPASLAGAPGALTFFCSFSCVKTRKGDPIKGEDPNHITIPMFIETIRIQDGHVCHLSDHTDRMRRTADHFGFTAPTLPTDLASLVPDELRTGTVRCRVMYDHTLREVTFTPYRRRHIERLFAVDAGTTAYAFKYADRAPLARPDVPLEASDELLFVREGLLTDTSYTNLVLRRGRELVTPDTFLLDGTCRRRLLRTGQIRTARIRLQDLPTYDELLLINAMMPLREAIRLPTTAVHLDFYTFAP